MKLITKVILLIAALMLPVIALYAYSHRQSTKIVEEQITIANQQRLGIFLHQIEGTMEQVSQYSNLIAQDPDFSRLAGNILPSNGYDYALLLGALESKLRLFSMSTAWMNRINVYFPQSGHAISSYSSLEYDAEALLRDYSAVWDYRPVNVSGLTNQAFTRFFVEPASASSDLTRASIVVEINLMADNIASLLDTFKTKGNNDPFLYRAEDHEYVANDSADVSLIGQLIDSDSLGRIDPETGYREVRLDGNRYLVYALTSDKLGWTLVDYVPLESILKPVNESRTLFFLTADLLILMGAAAAYLIYFQVQVPIRMLGSGVERLEQGELSARIAYAKNKDFDSLFRGFNRMAKRMQHLIDKVFHEELRAKEAVMKQLQAQINPHLLYNSLAYIISMAQMNRIEPVISMSYNMANYYRYTTRTDKIDTTIGEEIAFVISYIEIMDMQLNKIAFEIDIPEELEAMVIPKLLLQPIVENAIVHGLEPKLGNGRLVIRAWAEEEIVRVTVEEDGEGMAEEAMRRVNEALLQPEAPDRSFGLWNVHHRMRLRFGSDAGLVVTRSELGGVMVLLQWPAERSRNDKGDEFAERGEERD
jgi:Predicted signal transduction protein with a C-terminal ATPase domain